MSNVHADPQRMNTGFWKKLALAIKTMGESDEERMEKRVRCLEAEVARLSETLSQSPAAGEARPA